MKDADLWILIWEEVCRFHQEGILLEVEHVKAHRTKKEKQEITLFGRFVMGSNLLLRGAKEGASRHVWERREETGLGLRCVTQLSLLQLHSFTVTLRTPFWVPSLRPESVLLVCSVLMQQCHSHLPCVCPLPTIRVKNLVSYFAFQPAEVQILCKTLTVEDGKEFSGTFTALDTPAFEDLVSVV